MLRLFLMFACRIYCYRIAVPVITIYSSLLESATLRV